MAQATGFESFPFLQRTAHLLGADRASMHDRGLVRAVVITICVLPAVFWIVLLLGNTVYRPNYFSGDRFLVISPMIVVDAVLRCVLPLISFLFLLDYVQKSAHFREYLTELNSLNGVVSANLILYGRRLEIAFLLIIFPCYALIEVLTILIGTDFSYMLRLIYAVINLLAAPLHILLVSLAGLVVTLLGFTLILDINNYTSVVPTMTLDVATTQWNRYERTLRHVSRATGLFMALLLAVSSTRWLLQIAQAVFSGAAPTLGTNALYLLIATFTLRIAAWVTDRTRAVVDDLWEQHAKSASAQLVQFWMRLLARRPAWRSLGTALTPGTFLLFAGGYALSFVAVVAIALASLMNVANAEPFMNS